MELPQWFRSLPIGREMVERADAEVAATRDEHIAAIAKLEEERRKTVPALAKAVDTALDAYAAAERKLQEAKLKLGIAHNNQFCAMQRIDAAIARHQMELTQTADELVDEFYREIQAELNRTRKAGYDVIEGLNYVRGVPTRIATCNGAAVNARLRRLTEALQNDIPLLRFLPTTELNDAMQAIRDSLPATREVWDDPALARHIANAQTVVVDDGVHV